MSGVGTINDEFEVGFKVVMALFTAAAALGFLGRGPFSHATVRSADGNLMVDYEPIARHGTSTTTTVRIKEPQSVEAPIRLSVDQKIIEPMGYQYSIPLANSSTISDRGMRLEFNKAANQSDVLVRFQVMPNAVGSIPPRVSDVTDAIGWTVLVVP
jgi:hypothetical protein